MKPLILAVDTTHEHGSLALARGNDLVEEVALHSPTGFAHVLFGALEALLDRYELNVADLDLVASASGPGSFTGVRVGLSFAKGLAEAAGKRAVAVSNLRALAWFGSAPLRAAFLDARRGEIYGAVYDSDGRLESDEAVLPAAKWLEALPQQRLEFVTSDAVFARGVLAGTRYEGAATVEAPRAMAGAIASIAAQVFDRGEAMDPAALDANYVRRPDAELLWKG